MPRTDGSEPARVALPRTLPCACASLRRAARAVTQLYDEELRPTGLRATQFTLLQVLAGIGETMQGTLGELLSLDSTTLTRTLAPLRAKGWIRIRPGADRRERLVQLTPDGRHQLERARPAWDRAQQRLRRRLETAEWDNLMTALLRVTGAAQHA